MRNLINLNKIQYGFSILGCFIRSLDESHIKNDRIHLIIIHHGQTLIQGGGNGVINTLNNKNPN